MQKDTIVKSFDTFSPKNTKEIPIKLENGLFPKSPTQFLKEYRKLCFLKKFHSTKKPERRPPLS